ncbi:MAG: AmmeMemoRadiSam system protein A [Sulfuricella sp.]|nr:AmmeMemoRadiSam system protein A [Sulfuricella sp.]
MSIEKCKVLLTIARATIARHFGLVAEADESAPWLAEPGATFVTLTQHGNLRGCIGSLEAHRPLLEDVKANALAAAFRDPRFPPLTVEEFPATHVEISLLSPLQAIGCCDESDACAQLRPFEDGVVLEYGWRRGTFLPQVWEQLPGRAEFMAHLKGKAGLPADFWADDIKLYRYTVSKWKEANAS